MGRAQLTDDRDHRCFILIGHCDSPAVFMAGLMVVSGRYVTGLRLLAEGHGDLPPDVGLTIDSQQSAHKWTPFLTEI